MKYQHNTMRRREVVLGLALVAVGSQAYVHRKLLLRAARQVSLRRGCQCV